MPKLQNGGYAGAGDQTWRATVTGLTTGKTYTLDAEAFASVQTQFGKIPAGYPVARAEDGTLTPWTGTGDFAGHILFDQDGAHGDNGVAVYWEGAVYKDKIPGGSFTAPTAQPLTQITYF